MLHDCDWGLDWRRCDLVSHSKVCAHFLFVEEIPLDLGSIAGVMSVHDDAEGSILDDGRIHVDRETTLVHAIQVGIRNQAFWLDVFDGVPADEFRQALLDQFIRFGGQIDRSACPVNLVVLVFNLKFETASEVAVLEFEKHLFADCVRIH